MSHTCHAAGCEKAVPPRMFMCLRHWRMLPQPMKDAIWRHYRPGQEIDKKPSLAYLDAANETINWLAARESRQGELL